MNRMNSIRMIVELPIRIIVLMVLHLNDVILPALYKEYGSPVVSLTVF